ncbi:Putative RxLR effector [Phytophthora palmivora]|uniref:RxLR effector protein n=1 Tax=Phytophthora palmivora TaxID=4796 RepID=A0A2P4Y0J4_9STRA|nr:Putative RxLR effector [Phytophthora palmivora]
MRSAIFIVAIVTALVSSSIVVKAVSEEQSNLSNVIQDTTVESVAKHMNNNLRGLRAYESDTTNDEERAFGLDKVASALHIGKEAKALKLFQNKATLQKFIDKDIHLKCCSKQLV